MRSGRHRRYEAGRHVLVVGSGSGVNGFERPVLLLLLLTTGVGARLRGEGLADAAAANCIASASSVLIPNARDTGPMRCKKTSENSRGQLENSLSLWRGRRPASTELGEPLGVSCLRSNLRHGCDAGCSRAQRCNSQQQAALAGAGDDGVVVAERDAGERLLRGQRLHHFVAF